MPHKGLNQHDIRNLLHPDDAAETLRTWEEALTFGKTFVAEVPLESDG